MEEDFELFNPFRFLLDNENLIFAEHNGKTIGFLLWYPDFNQLVRSSFRQLNLFDVIKYRFSSTIDTFRFTEIGILPEYQRSPASLAMFLAAYPAIKKGKFRYCEGGFIFENNKQSIQMVSRFIERAMGEKVLPHRRYAVYEDIL